MTLERLNDEQIRSMSVQQKDAWWLNSVYRGNVPQLTLRSALTGMILGGVLSLSNLYIGIKTGWTFGVGVTAVVLAFSFFKILSRLGVVDEFSLLENNAMQSVATSAGYMTGPLVSSMPAYMLTTNQIIPMSHMIIWMILLSLLGVLFAFPLKRRFINDEQLPFPEGQAAAVVMANLHVEGEKEGIQKAKILATGAGFSALIETLRDDAFMRRIHAAWAAIPAYWDDFLYSSSSVLAPKIMGTPLKELTIRWDSSVVMLAIGGLVGIKTGASMLVGGVACYFIFVPCLLAQGIIVSTSFKDITMISMWPGVAMMTTSSLYSFFAKPKVFKSAFSCVLPGEKKSRRNSGDALLRDIELPMWLAALGIPVLTCVLTFTGHIFFGFDFWVGLVAIPLTFVFTLIAVQTTGLTSMTPTGTLGKLTQLSFGALAPNDIQTNIMAAGMTGEVAANASNLLMDIKAGYMLGAKPRQQAVGHVLGIIAGGLVAVPVFYIFLQGELSRIGLEATPFPGAQIWRGVAEILSKGLSSLTPTAQYAAVVGGVLGILIEHYNQRTKGRFPISAVGLGLAAVIPFSNCWSISIGALLFWVLKQKFAEPRAGESCWRGAMHTIFVRNHETICAGLIAGGSIMGIIIIILNSF